MRGRAATERAKDATDDVGPGGGGRLHGIAVGDRHLFLPAPDLAGGISAGRPQHALGVAGRQHDGHPALHHHLPLRSGRDDALRHRLPVRHHRHAAVRPGGQPRSDSGAAAPSHHQRLRVPGEALRRELSQSGLLSLRAADHYLDGADHLHLQFRRGPDHRLGSLRHHRGHRPGDHLLYHRRRAAHGGLDRQPAVDDSAGRRPGHSGADRILAGERSGDLVADLFRSGAD